MVSWWHRDVIAAGKLPLMLCFLAFVVTFATTRTITRLIRDGRGPFRNQVTASGTHIHHAVPGLILLMIGAFTAIASPGTLGWLCFAGLAVGIGTSLVLDEFALILHLQDVYWSGEGQLSVEAVSLTAACLGLALVGFSPFGVQDADGVELSLRLTATSLLCADFVLSVICALKGKYRSALFGLFLLPVGVVGALRLARPTSDLGPAPLPRQAPGAGSAAGRRVRRPVGTPDDGLGGLPGREAVAAQPGAGGRPRCRRPGGQRPACRRPAGGPVARGTRGYLTAAQLRRAAPRRPRPRSRPRSRRPGGGPASGRPGPARGRGGSSPGR